jgi:hypothetical protein
MRVNAGGAEGAPVGQRKRAHTQVRPYGYHHMLCSSFNTS